MILDKRKKMGLKKYTDGMDIHYTDDQFREIIGENQLSEWLEIVSVYEVYRLIKFIERHYKNQHVYRSQLLNKIDHQFF